MDILIDLIIFLIKQATKPRPPGMVPPRLQSPQPPTALAEQIRAMQKTIASQQARTRPRGARQAAGRGPVSWSQPGVTAAVPPVSQRPVPPITRDPVAPRPRPSPKTQIPGLRLPFLLGEILAPPVALREEESF